MSKLELMEIASAAPLPPEEVKRMIVICTVEPWAGARGVIYAHVGDYYYITRMHNEGTMVLRETEFKVEL